MVAVLGATGAGRTKGRPVDPATPPTVQPVGQTSGWALTMSEEFDDGMTVVDPAQGFVRFHDAGILWRAWYPNYLHHAGRPRTANRQNPHTGNPPQERQYYGLGGLSVQNGSLRQTATRNFPQRDFEYTSGCITSHPGHNQTYGFFEARMRLPGVPMQWPAFWLFPQVWQYSPDGLTSIHYEMDVMEVFDHPGGGKSSNHCPGNNIQNDGFGEGATIPTNNTDVWHTYALEWTPDRLQFYFDGQPRGWDVDGVPHIPFFVIANLAIRDFTSPGTRPWPEVVHQDVDYIRCWKAA